LLRKRQGGQGLVGGDFGDHAVVLVGRISVDQNPRLFEVDQPDLGDARPGVERNLDQTIDAQGGVGNFHEEQDVLGGRAAGGVEVGAGAQQDEIRLGLRAFVEPHRILRADLGMMSQSLRKKGYQAFHRRGVPRANWAHLDDLAVEELHAVVFTENPGLPHTLIFVDRKTPSRQFKRHRWPPGWLDYTRSFPTPPGAFGGRWRSGR